MQNSSNDVDSHKDVPYAVTRKPSCRWQTRATRKYWFNSFDVEQVTDKL